MQSPLRLAHALGSLALLGAGVIGLLLGTGSSSPRNPWIEDTLVLLYVCAALGAGIALDALLRPAPRRPAASALTLNAAAIAALTALPLLAR